jgi:predicted Zn-dependent protease with MMP-like domain
MNTQAILDESIPKMPDAEFEILVAQALDELPVKYTSRLDNVAIVYADEPTPQQRQELKLRCRETLFGLYQGVPLPQRGSGYNLVLPDKITIFKLPLLAASSTHEELQANIKHTLWHEIAHHFGLGHERIHELEDKRSSSNH